MDCNLYEKQLKCILENLLNNQSVLVIDKNSSFQEILDKLLSMDSNFDTSNLNFSNDNVFSNEFCVEHFDKVYIFT